MITFTIIIQENSKYAAGATAVEFHGTEKDSTKNETDMANQIAFAVKQIIDKNYGTKIQGRAMN